MSSEDRSDEDDYKPRPNDFMIEPMFAPFEKKEAPAEPEAAEEDGQPSLVRRLLNWLKGD
jgi:hypothetical protein